jgi:hypothetical protein
MKRNIGTAGGIRFKIEKNLVGRNILFVDLFGNSYTVAAKNHGGALTFAAKLEKIAKTIRDNAQSINSLS